MSENTSKPPAPFSAKTSSEIPPIVPPVLSLAPLMRFGDALSELRADADAAHESKRTGQPRGPITGFDALDEKIGYGLAPGVHALYGNTGTGKTALALQIASTCRYPALYVTCEMPPAELLRRHTARITQTYLGRFKSGEFTGEYLQQLAEKAITSTPHLALLDATLAPAPPDHIANCALIARGDAKSILIVIDSLQTWAESVGPGGGEYEVLNLAMRSLRELSLKLRSPVIFISERNRDANKESRTGSSGAGINAGAGTRKIEYSAETIFDLEKEKEELNAHNEHAMRLWIHKNRHGQSGISFKLFFNGALQQYRQPSTEENVADAVVANQTRQAEMKTKKRHL